MSSELILVIDQGTTSSRAIVFDSRSNLICMAQEEYPQHYPREGWVEHDLEEIWQSVYRTAKKAFDKAESGYGRIVALGITNQRETTAVWDRNSGKPVYKAIVWQDRRTADLCQDLINDNLSEMVFDKTGLVIDPYFSATKIAWILDSVEGARERANRGELAFGTIDSYLMSRFTLGNVHATDATNASRTSLFNIGSQEWDEELLRLYNVPSVMLPTVKDCSDNFGEVDASVFGRSIPILGVAGDQQAAAFGQCCFDSGSLKSTYGTGCFVMINTGNEIVRSKHKLLSTVAYRLGKQTTYALEGSIFVAGAAVQWLRDGLEIITRASETEKISSRLPDNGGVYLVPAFTGIGAPYWNPNARGLITGLTLASKPDHLVRAALEAVCYQSHDLFNAIREDGIAPGDLRVDGGMVANNWLMQFLADILNLRVDRPAVMETTALGAAYLAGLKAGLFESPAQIASQWKLEREFSPTMESDKRNALLQGWSAAIEKAVA